MLAGGENTIKIDILRKPLENKVFSQSFKIDTRLTDIFLNQTQDWLKWTENLVGGGNLTGNLAGNLTEILVGGRENTIKIYILQKQWESIVFSSNFKIDTRLT